MGYSPLPWPVFWDQYFSWFLPARSLRNNDLEVKSLFFFHLGTFCGQFWPRDGNFWLPPDAGPLFRPDQKVKLDKKRGQERVFSSVMARWNPS
jgi:hypothetical protein